MKTLLRTVLMSVFILLPSISIAQLPDSTAMTCQQATNFVASRGSVVLIYDHHAAAGPLYKRFYGAPSDCPAFTRFKKASARTIDSPNCIVGGVCRDVERDAFWLFQSGPSGMK